jgi:hypothetical protein
VIPFLGTYLNLSRPALLWSGERPGFRWIGPLESAAGAGLSNLKVVLRNRVAGNAREASAASESRPNNPNGVATVARRASLVSGEDCLET